MLVIYLEKKENTSIGTNLALNLKSQLLDYMQECSTEFKELYNAKKDSLQIRLILVSYQTEPFGKLKNKEKWLK